LLLLLLLPRPHARWRVNVFDKSTATTTPEIDGE